jgi:hypothetical protein
LKKSCKPRTQAADGREVCFRGSMYGTSGSAGILGWNREELWTLTEARVVIEDWRWKYNHVRPDRSLGYITLIEFAQDEVGKEPKSQCRAFARATPSLRQSIDLLYDIEQIMTPSRLTKALDQFG